MPHERHIHSPQPSREIIIILGILVWQMHNNDVRHKRRRVEEGRHDCRARRDHISL